MRVAVTGAAGRLGRALIAALADAPRHRPARLERDRPEVVVHAAAWTDVDGCALDPGLAMRRNAHATGVLADACAGRGTDLFVISTNEVFDGDRDDGRPYQPTDRISPCSPYGESKAEGERLATAAFERQPGASLGIARTAWLFGTPGRDFPSRILDAAERARAAGEPLRAVADEWGTPTYTDDAAEAIVELLAADAVAGIHHVVNGLFATRADWARDVVARAGLDVEVVNVPSSTWERPSRPPRWGVLAATPLPSGEPLRAWPDAMADYAPRLLRAAGRA